jgi:glutamate-1-semialdehyde 2,1-aminomutase
MPAGVTYSIRHLEPYPFYARRASGCHIEDVDGRRLTDYWCGHFALILGHGHPQVVDALKSQAEKGAHFGVAHELEVELAAKVVEHVPSADMVRFCTSGTEACMYAIRLARTYTRRKLVGKFEGGWHGGYDALHKAVHPPFDRPESGGLLPETLRNTVVLPFNDLPAAEQVLRREELACVIIEPVLGGGGMIPADEEFLAGLREACDEASTLLIFDEVITGFRLGLGGAQEYYGVTPDITVLGKILGGAMPIGAIAGRGDVMERIDHTKYTREEMSFHGGTWTGHPMAMAAGLATLKVLEREPVHDRINSLGEEVRRRLAEVLTSAGIDAQLTGAGSLFGIHFTPEHVRDAQTAGGADRAMTRRCFDFLLNRGIFLPNQRQLHGSISYAHTRREIDALVAAVEEFAAGPAHRPS